MSREFVGGMFNAQKCARYLRSVGVEVTPEVEQSWRDSEKVERFCEKLKRPRRTGILAYCQKGHRRVVIRVHGGRKLRILETPCPECGAKSAGYRTLWVETHDGTLKDYRPKEERWRKLDDVESL